MLWILARQSCCNIFHLSVCVRSSELHSGVHLSVSSSPRVILVGTVVRAAASVVFNSVLTQRKLRVTQTWQPQFGLQSISRDSPRLKCAQDVATIVPVKDTRTQCTTSLPPIKERLLLDAQRMVENPKEK